MNRRHRLLIDSPPVRYSAMNRCFSLMQQVPLPITTLTSAVTRYLLPIYRSNLLPPFPLRTTPNPFPSGKGNRSGVFAPALAPGNGVVCAVLAPVPLFFVPLPAREGVRG